MSEQLSDNDREAATSVIPERKRRPGRPATHGPRAHITMNWDLEMIEAVRDLSEHLSLSRDQIVHLALQDFRAKHEREKQL